MSNSELVWKPFSDGIRQIEAVPVIEQTCQSLKVYLLRAGYTISGGLDAQGFAVNGAEVSIGDLVWRSPGVGPCGVLTAEQAQRYSEVEARP